MVQSRAVGASLSDIISKIDRDLTDVRDEFLTRMADDIVQASPVWTGRYVTSHSIGTSSSAGQFTENLEGFTEKTSVPDAYKAEARGNLRADIANLPKDAQRIYINNNSPHAVFVEYIGWPKFGKGPHGVYSEALNRANNHLQDAVNTVKARQ
jgi:hypothetical protein